MPADLIQAVFLCAFPVLVIIAGLYDITTFTIPNWISGALALLFIPAAIASQLTLVDFGLSAGVGLAALVAAIVMFALNWIGGGDAKLFAAAALWIGWPTAIHFMVVTGLAGGVLAVSLMAMRSAWLRRYAAAGPGWLNRLATPGGSAPYGVAIAAGALITFPNSVLLGG